MARLPVKKVIRSVYDEIFGKTRREKAREIGFNREAYHGTLYNEPIDEFIPSDLGVHVGTSSQANKRVNDIWEMNRGYIEDPDAHDAPNVYPLLVSAHKGLNLPDVGMWNDSISVMQLMEEMERLPPSLRLPPGFSSNDVDELAYERRNWLGGDDGYAGWLTSNDNKDVLNSITENIENHGYDHIKYDNLVESGIGDTTKSSMIILDPANIRSVFANFDPYKRKSRNIMAGGASAATGLGLMGAPDEGFADTGMGLMGAPDEGLSDTVQAAKHPWLMDYVVDPIRKMERDPLGQLVAPTGIADLAEKHAYGDDREYLDYLMAAMDLL